MMMERERQPNKQSRQGLTCTTATPFDSRYWFSRAACTAGECSVILLTAPSPSVLKHLLKGEGVQQNGRSLAGG